MRRLRFTRLSVVLLCGIGGLALIPAPAGAAAPAIYVALGDSYTAGPLIPAQILSAVGCLRSDHNYPHVVAAAVHAGTLRDASCSGATTADMTGTQFVAGGSNAPQFNRLSSDTSVVTLEIGGNDIGFTGIIINCASLLPWGSPCHDKFVTGGHDQISDRINAAAPKIAAVIDGIDTRAPHAQVLVLGYPAILPDSGGGCWPTMPITSRDVPYLRAKEKQLNSTIAAQASAHGATYVNVYAPSVGHDACSAWSTRWVEPVVPLHPAAPVHPNATGEHGMANAVRAALGA